ncbi:General transcription factor II-I repeat domain-containing protein 2 [Eumeta japonica]|uniref:General transcription factor II-I repeat domain-containing protein 2 n=1 Tax=Eumeta variegata TaxID=151549 RepID=A0A4C1ZSW6_EUMVA|nr:General transcription factor II-I repeat domain-containing protein 2 [Eumeta japonica]
MHAALRPTAPPRDPVLLHPNNLSDEGTDGILTGRFAALSAISLIGPVFDISNSTRTSKARREGGGSARKSIPHKFISLDESTDLSDTAQLAIFIRGVDKEFTVTEELFALQPLKEPLQERTFLMKFKSHLKAFQNKIRLWEVQMLSRYSYYFTTLSVYENIAYAQYAEELKLLSQQFSNRFSDFKDMEDCFNLFASPTKSNVQNTPTHLQMELIEIQEKSFLKSKFEDVELCDFYKKYLEEDHFPKLRKFPKRLIFAFGSTYKCEQNIERPHIDRVPALNCWSLIEKYCPPSVFTGFSPN